MEVSEGPLGGPRGVTEVPAMYGIISNKWEICVKADKGKFAKELSLLKIDQNVGNMCKTRQPSILIVKVDRLKFAGGP